MSSISSVSSTTMVDPATQQMNDQLMKASSDEIMNNVNDSNDQTNKDMKEVWDQFQ